MLVSLFKSSFIMLDDAYTSMLFHKWDIIFKDPVFGFYFSSTLDRIFGINLPIKLHIHPSTFKSIYFSYIEAVIFLSFLSCFPLMFKKKKDLIFPVVFLFSVSSVLLILQKQAFMLYVYDGFFRMLLPALMFVIAVYIFSSGPKLSSYILLPPLIFLCAISNEFITVTLVIGLFLYLIISLKFFKNNIPFVSLAFILSLLGLTVMIINGVFMRKTVSEINFEYIFNVFLSIKTYSISYFKFVIIEHIPGYILFISQIIFINKKLKQNEQILSLESMLVCFIIGGFSFFALLIFLGKTHYGGGYWVEHEDLHVIWSIMLLAFNLILLNIINLNNLIKPRYINSLLVISSIIILIINSDYYNKQNNLIRYMRTVTYTTEKVIRVAGIQNKTAYLSGNIPKEYLFYPLYENFEEHELDKVYNNSIYSEFLNNFSYMPKIDNSWIFLDKVNDNNCGIYNGVSFTNDELNNPDFEKLIDINFLKDSIINSDKSDY